ncbi:MAG: tetratricopeptide repeat protein [Isosphaeraceae bacterium]
MAGQLDEAEALYPRVISRASGSWGLEHPDVLANQVNFAALLHVRGRFEQAEKP